jgi:predicted AlkP superfamily phosphohydrolase/phosphomutase
MNRCNIRMRICLTALLWVILLPSSAWAYIGPGAGFALAGSFLAIFGAVLSACSMILFWPIRRLLRLVLRRRPPGKSRFKRVVILGLDGLDYGLTERFIAEGKLPHLKSLQQQGDFRSLASTLPPISPVAWATFQTGVNPGKHNIFDFLTPDFRSYQAKLSSVEIRPARRTFSWRTLAGLTAAKPGVRLLRKSQPFWTVLSRYGIFNCIQRVPITFPPERLRGVTLSAMCVPDLRGSQGTFSLYTTRAIGEGETTGGDVHVVHRHANQVTAELLGPPDPKNPHRPLRLPFKVTLCEDGSAILKLGGNSYRLEPGRYTDWLPLKFSAGWGTKISGICRVLLLSTKPEFELYVTPINIDPEAPAMSIGYPSVYPIYLAKQQGPYATLGLAEDTWALSENVLDDAQFTEQCRDIEHERELMFFDGLEKVRQGLCVCVFDGSDRMQHMFWRYLDHDHPALPSNVPAEFRSAIENMYVRMDQLVGRTIAKCQGTDSLLMVVSDHGFTAFRRGVDLNRWLEQNGYLVVDDRRRSEQHLAGVDWSQTRAFAIGLSGIFLNLAGTFEQGIVQPGEQADQLRDEIQQRLSGLPDTDQGTTAIKRVFQAQRAYRGPYINRAPDLIVGYASGYRASWETAIGRISRDVFHDNKKAWSGDHCVDPSEVPGVLFCSHKIQSTRTRLSDVAPTVLELFGVPVPEYMDGTAWKIGEAGAELPLTPMDADPRDGSALTGETSQEPTEAPTDVEAGEAASQLHP